MYSLDKRPKPRKMTMRFGGIRELGWVGMHWTDLAQDREQLRAPVSTARNIQVP
jgi:hypothetical protein